MHEPDLEFGEFPPVPGPMAPDDVSRAVARMAEGVAHQIRNPLTGIAAGVDFLGRALASDPAHSENVLAVRREVDRLNSIVEDLLTVTHPPALAWKTVSYSGLEASLGGRFRESFPGQLLSFAGGAGDWRADEVELQRALWELLKNAAEASEDGARVRLGVCEIGGGLPDSKGPAWLAIRVSDEGPGLAPSVCKGLFEPFRTTRAGHKGLGLFIAHDIARRHGGELTVEDAPEKGVQATLYLPWKNPK